MPDSAIQTPGAAPALAPVSQPGTVADVLRMLQTCTDPALMEKQIDLYERVQRIDAERQFNAALAAFHRERPPLKMTHTMTIKGKGENARSWSSTYANEADVQRDVIPALHRHGLTYSFSAAECTPQAVRVSCTLRHVAGHKGEPVSSAIYPIGGNPAITAQQAVNAAVAFARVSALLLALGIKGNDAEDVPGGADVPSEAITDEQVAELESLIAECGAPDVRGPMLTWLGRSSVEWIGKNQFDETVKNLKAKVKQRKGAQ